MSADAPEHAVTMASAGAPEPAHQDEVPREPIVDWIRTARRMRAVLLMLGALVVLGWLIAGLVGDGWSLRLLAELFGFGIMAAFAAEVVIVGGSAVRGLLRAGERGDRLSSPDVSLLPPQLIGRLRRR